MARILVIDDDSDIAALVGLKLELDGHTVSIEGEGTRGLTRARQERPDVLIVDWTLPGLSGPEICEQLRSDPATSGMWMIMLTARPLDADSIAAAGADEVLAKPFSPRNLSERVNAALRR
jgi:two-component system phosphate regulon response regulator PhoB